MSVRPMLPAVFLATGLLSTGLLAPACTSDYDIKGMPGPGEAGQDEDASAEDPDAEAPTEDEDGSTEDLKRADGSYPLADLGGEGRVIQDEDPAGGGEGLDEEEDETDPAPADDCERASDLVYVIARDDAGLYTFDPEALTMTRQGTLRCGTSGNPESMSVARDGVAYVRYSDDRVYAVDLETLDCAATDYSDRSTGFGSFGMGYATDDADTWRDQLYVANDARLARLDTRTWELSTLGRLPSQSELTGNAEGELWAILPLESPAQLARLDKEDASTLETILLPRFPDAGDIDTFAFATWGGDFWIFVRESGMGSSTDVYQVEPDGAMTKVLSEVGFDVVGAGVSTCAPTE